MRSSIAIATGVLLVLAGCSAGHPGATHATPSPSGSAQFLAIAHEAAQCMRQHGIPDFPDPILDANGQISLPEGPGSDRIKQEINANPDAQHACEPIFDRIPTSAVHSGAAVSPQDVPKLLAFAQCLRRNGIPEWPDPKADGSFPISGTPLATEGKSPRLRAAIQACRQYWDKGIVGS
jgi:hypothetical protein